MKRCLNAVILTVVAFSLVGCGSHRDKAARIMLQTLEDRYEEEFVIDSMGGSWGTFDDSTIKAWVYPVENKDSMFQAQIKKDFSRVDDQYMQLIMEDKLTHEFEPLLSTLYGERFDAVFTVYHSMIDTGSKQSDIKTFFSEQKQKAGTFVDLFVKSEAPINKEDELECLKALAERFNELFQEEARMYVYYLSEEVFNNLETNLNEVESIYKYYSDPLNCVNYAKIVFPVETQTLTTELFRD